jgi:hypothetical protein
MLQASDAIHVATAIEKAIRTGGLEEVTYLS